MWVAIGEMAGSSAHSDLAKQDHWIFRRIFIRQQPGIIALTNGRIWKGWQIQLYFIGKTLPAGISPLSRTVQARVYHARVRFRGSCPNEQAPSQPRSHHVDEHENKHCKKRPS